MAVPRHWSNRFTRIERFPDDVYTDWDNETGNNHANGCARLAKHRATLAFTIAFAIVAILSSVAVLALLK